MDWAHHESQFRFDIRAEREECERLFRHQARVLQDRMVHTDRTKRHATSEWEKLYQIEAQERRLLYHARVLSWGKEKRYYHAHKH
jgi:tRNA C32,U32 (ribose-2'-O)-methylase TrmJ